ncbi:MAG TPA: archaemetzincin [Burkholderiales bacterium]
MYLRSSARMAFWLPTAFDDEDELRRARAVADALRPLFRRKGRPAHNEWLDFFDEPGQTLNQYVRDYSPSTRETKGSIVILPFGEFKDTERRIISEVARLVEIFYGRPAMVLPDEPVPLGDKERRGSGRGQQLFTTPLLEWLKRRLPSDAAVLLGITAMDLTPPETGWNFVYGQASLTDRVGVWSMYRLATRELSAPMQLRRVAQTAVHELGHMFGMWHCTAYECGMNGSNLMSEADAAPLSFCPECDAKVLWRFRLDPAARYRQLAQFAASHAISRDAELWGRCAAVVGL